MYAPFLVLHSFTRWLVLLGLIILVVKSWWGWKGKHIYSALDNKLRVSTLVFTHLQACVGLCLYVISPLVGYFLQNFPQSMSERQVRFFGMEHITMMLLATVLVTIGSVRAKRKTTDIGKYKTLAIYGTIALLVILSSIPWAFSPLISRPYFRWF